MAVRNKGGLDPRRAATRTKQAKAAVGKLEEYLGFHLKMAQAAVARAFIDAVHGTGISQRLHATLRLIADCERVSQIEIAAVLQIDRATMMAITARLERSGLVAKVQAPDDRRRYELSLTKKGQLRLGEVERTVRRFETALSAKFSAKELTALVNALRKLYARSPATPRRRQ
jgi:DNA-binding MarR family transcriptional regulator